MRWSAAARTVDAQSPAEQRFDRVHRRALQIADGGQRMGSAGGGSLQHTFTWPLVPLAAPAQRRHHAVTAHAQSPWAMRERTHQKSQSRKAVPRAACQRRVHGVKAA